MRGRNFWVNAPPVKKLRHGRHKLALAGVFMSENHR